MAALTYLIPREEEGLTAETLYLKRLHISRHMLSRLKFSGGLLLDGHQIRSDHICHAGQTLQARFPEDAPAWPALKGPLIPFGVLYRDDHILVVDKPAPLSTLASPRGDGMSLEGAVYRYLGEPERFCFRPVNRLDKGTSGLMAVALHPQAQAALQKQLHHTMQRQYLAVTEGVPEGTEGRITLKIGKESPDSVRRIITPDGKTAVTDWRVLSVSGARSLLSLTLLTGRTHQIRVHLNALGCPVAGDYLYGTPLDEIKGRFALHSCLLTLNHPVSGRAMTFQSPLPPALERLMNGGY